MCNVHVLCNFEYACSGLVHAYQRPQARHAFKELCCSLGTSTTQLNYAKGNEALYSKDFHRQWTHVSWAILCRYVPNDSVNNAWPPRIWTAHVQHGFSKYLILLQVCSAVMHSQQQGLFTTSVFRRLPYARVNKCRVADGYVCIPDPARRKHSVEKR